jgi:L-alanine-DL-glutamate epimerase-like enolase superfamily enzyme
MKIVSVQSYPLSYPLEVPFQDATGVWTEWSTILVKITAENGSYGWGEIGPLHGGGIQVFDAIVKHKLRGLLLGENLFDRERLYAKMLGSGTSSYAFGQRGAIVTAIAGIDIALWDLAGKVLKVPIYNMLGGACHDKLPAYASGFFGKGGASPAAEECREEAKMYADAGFKGIKMKIGFGRDVDLRNLEAVRSALGPEPGLMVDANQGFSFHEIIKIAKDISAFDLTFLEEPISINDIDAMAELVKAVDIPIAAGENNYTRYEFRDLLVKRAVNIIQPDIIHAGGISETKKIIDLASCWNIPIAPHIHATVGVAASIHLLIATPGALAAEYITSGGSYELRKALCGDSFMVADGFISAPDLPGLGIEINDKALEKYAAPL